MRSCPRCGQAIQDSGATHCPGCGTEVAVEAAAAVMAGPPPVSRWYVLRDQQRSGPYSWEQMQDMAAAGRVHPKDYVWKEGAPDWVEARLVPRLCAVPAADVVEAITEEPRRRRRPDWDGEPAAAAAFFTMLWLHLRRAFAWNLAAVPVAESERRTLQTRGVDNDAAQKYLVWRRSIFFMVSIATGLSVFLHVISMSVDGFEDMTSFGVFAEVMSLLSTLAMPTAAILACVFWSRVRLSRWLLILGWTVSFAIPVLFALFPFHWLWRLPAPEPGVEAEEVQQTIAVFQFLGGFAYFVMLMPTVLSILPGVLRACIRVKALVPQTMVTGWLLIAATPFYGLLLFVTFVTINQVAGNPLLILAVIFFMGAPLVYLAGAGLFTRPLVDRREIRRIAVLQTVYTAMIALAIVFLLSYLFTGSFLNKRLMGFSRTYAFFLPWQLVQLYIDFVGRSLFTSTLVADLFLLMDRSVWHHMKEFAPTEEARRYDDTMKQLGAALREN